MQSCQSARWLSGKTRGLSGSRRESCRAGRGAGGAVPPAAPASGNPTALRTWGAPSPEPWGPRRPFVPVAVCLSYRCILSAKARRSALGSVAMARSPAHPAPTAGDCGGQRGTAAGLAKPAASLMGPRALETSAFPPSAWRGAVATRGRAQRRRGGGGERS